MIVAAYILLILYSLLILFYWYGWSRMREFKEHFEPIVKFSIVIPARNEAEHISKCLDGILDQDYPDALFEIIVVNDHSSDNTAEVVDSYKVKYNNITLLDAAQLGSTNKKGAITAAVDIAANDYIILTDADCTHPKTWLQSINSFVQSTGGLMLYAPVIFKANNWFEKIQSLEFAGLVGIGGSAIALKNPNMCSAANLIFTKNVFKEVDGYYDNEHIGSGDDEFLLHKVFKKYPERVHFLKDKRAIVNTSANTSIKALVNQRRRWVSKSTKYENRYITAILVGAYLFNFSIFAFLVLSPLNKSFLIHGLTILGCKTLVEGLFLNSLARFFSIRPYMLLLPLAEPFHILYVLIIGIWANITSYQWKGRNHKQ